MRNGFEGLKGREAIAQGVSPVLCRYHPYTALKGRKRGLVAIIITPFQGCMRVCSLTHRAYILCYCLIALSGLDTGTA